MPLISFVLIVLVSVTVGGYDPASRADLAAPGGAAAATRPTPPADHTARSRSTVSHAAPRADERAR